jgi:hypothetical protein
VVVRYYAPDLGGAERPRFITERQLFFEARLQMIAEQSAETRPEDRHVQSALDTHVAETMLAKLPLERGPSIKEMNEAFLEVRQAFIQRYGGPDRILLLAREQGLDDAELTEIVQRKVQAAIYMDRQMAPFLKPSDDQLREVYRTAAHNFRSRPYEQVKPDLTRWFVMERMQVLSLAFLQGARARVKISIITR